ncbi:MAG TPA: class I SAM-dependent methyltransferase [Spirochaetia bacterium]|nr:class I SAM-dependent methyltransferase [Spirochaetia bacterium]
MQDKKHKHGVHFGGHILPGFDPEVLLAREEHRKTMLPPDEILPQFLTRNDAVMLDLGCGAGFFTLPAARFLTAGKVYAVDLQKSMVDTTLRRVKEAQLSNVEGITAPAANVPLADSSVDVVLLSMMLHDIDTRTQALAEAARVLKPGGTLFMIEIDRIDGGFGPPMEVRIPPDELREMLRDAGFTVLEVSDSPRQKSLYFVRAELSAA